MVMNPLALQRFRSEGSVTRHYKGDGGGSTTSTTQNYSPEEAAQRAQVQSEASRIYGQTKGTIANSPYPGSQVVPYSSDTYAGQQLGRMGANSLVQDYLPQLSAATEYGLGGSMDINRNPYLQGTINAAVRPITESYTDPGGVMSQIRTSAISNGGQGQSTRQGIAEGVAAGRYASAVGDATSRVASDAYDKGQDTFSRIYGLAPQVANLYSQPASLYGGIGAQNEYLRQAQEDYSANARNWDLNSQWVPLQNWANIVYGNGASSASTTTSGGMQRNPITGALGGALAGAQLGSMVPGVGTGVGAAGGAILGALF